MNTGLIAWLIWVLNMKILDKSILKKLKKLKLPNTHRLRFAVGDNVNCLIKNNSGQVESVRARVTDTDKREYVCQLSHPCASTGIT